MSARLLDGRAIAAAIRESVLPDVHAFTARAGRPPGLAIVLVGENPASEIYVRNKVRAGTESGLRVDLNRLPATASLGELLSVVERLNALGVPTVSDRALQRSTAEVLAAIWEQDFLSCSFGGRPGLGAHHALATLNEVIAGGKIGWVLEADLKNFFGSLDHDWVLRFVEHRVGDPRLINLIRRWLKAGVLEDGAVHPSEMGTPQGGSISVLLSNLYLHYVLDLWFERVVKVRLRGEARLVRYIDDFVICFQYRSDALRVQDALRVGWAGSASLWSRARPNWSSSAGSLSDTRANVAAGNAQKPSTFWV